MIKSSVLNVKSTLYSSLLSRLTAVKLSAKIKKRNSFKNGGNGEVSISIVFL